MKTGRSDNDLEMGKNRTGIKSGRGDASEMEEVTTLTVPSAGGDAMAFGVVRVAYAKGSEPIGSVPPPATLAGLAKTMGKALTGKNATPFIDRLGERLAFERTGTRLYEALLSKLDAYGSWDGGPERVDLEHIRDDEHAHFLLLKDAIESLGGDPTSVTPAADVAAVASMGIAQVLADPRTNLVDSLGVIVNAELADEAGWEILIALTSAFDQEALVPQFENALDAERLHVAKVKSWFMAALSDLAGVPMPLPGNGHDAAAAMSTTRTKPARRAKSTPAARKPPRT